MNNNSNELKELVVQESEVTLNPSGDIVDNRIIDGEIVNPRYNNQGLISLSDLIDEFSPFPRQSCILGLCEDGLPLMLDLADPRTSSILILSENKSWLRNLIKFLLTSLIEFNQPSEVRFAMISPDRFGWEFEARSPHCLVNYSPYQREASELVMNLCGIVEQRKSGRQLGPAVIMIIEDLSYTASSSLDKDISIHFRWLIEEGPNANVYTLASLSSVDINSIPERILSCFSRKIIGLDNSIFRLHESTSRSISSRKYPITFPQFGYKTASQFIKFIVPTI